MSSQISHKKVQCYACLIIIMRSDHFQRHLDSKHADMEKPGLKEQLLIDNELYCKNVEAGKYVFDMVTSGSIGKQSLSKEHVYVLNLYNKMRPMMWSLQSEVVRFKRELFRLSDAKWQPFFEQIS